MPEPRADTSASDTQAPSTAAASGRADGNTVSSRSESVGCGCAAESESTWRSRAERLPARVTALVVLALILFGLVLGGPFGAIPLTLGVVALLGVLAVTWPRITGVERLLRVALVVLVVGLALVRVLPR